MKEKPLVICSFTKNGSKKNEEISRILKKQGFVCNGFTLQKYAGKEGMETLQVLPSLLGKWIGAQWGRVGFLFIGAAGIAVRYIAPWVKDKYTDSPVLVMDEKGQYIIPILSGHMGNAVEIARQIAASTKAVPVLTTATDVQEKFAVDVFARRNGLYIGNRELAKRISAAVLEEKKIGFYSAYGWEGNLPKELVPYESLEKMKKAGGLGIAVTEEQERAKEMPVEKSAADKEHILFLFPQNIIAGIGCRKGLSCYVLEEQICRVFQKEGMSLARMAAIASIDLKKEEEGLLELAQKYQVPFHTYTAEQLQTVETLLPTELNVEGSAFVKQVTGVDNVCERAAIFACPQGRILLHKQKLGRMTIALVEQKVQLQF
ncbi:hypothetical protein DWX08_05855 [Ruminococcus sp. AF18-22]|nr:hypothetical protein DWX08_05855 [Ruminococcus sp. AF18-22]